MKYFNIEHVANEQMCVVRIAGELDASSSVAADTLLQKAITTENHALILDCQELEYISSAGLGVFLSVYHACRQKNIPFILIALQPKIRNILNIIGLAHILTIAETLQDALTVVKGN